MVYSQRRKEEFALMSMRVRSALSWNEYQLGVFIRSSQFIVSNLEKKSDRLARTPLLRRRCRRLTYLYKAVQAGAVQCGMSIEEARARANLPPSLRRYITKERDQDLQDTIKKATKAIRAPRFNTPSRVVQVPVVPPPLPEQPAPAPIPPPRVSKVRLKKPAVEQLSLGFPDKPVPTCGPPPMPPPESKEEVGLTPPSWVGSEKREQAKKNIDLNKITLRDLLIEVHKQLNSVIAITSRTEGDAAKLCLVHNVEPV